MATVTSAESSESPATDEPRAKTSRPFLQRALRAAPLYAPAVIIAIGGWVHRWVDEDAFINLRILDQIFAGHGPVFNTGARVESATSTLWLGVLAVSRLLLSWAFSMPWVALLTSLATAIAAFVVAGHATGVRHRGQAGVVVPVGLLAAAALTPFWDFSTSGLEMGLVWLWIATCWLALVSVARSETITGRQRLWSVIVIGLGVLVRPDLGLMMVCFAVAWFVLVRPRRIVHDLAWMFALPLLYEIFRMGYYAALVPTTALAKDASGLHLGQGRHYLWDFVHPYALWLPVLVMAVAIVLQCSAERDRRVAIAVGALIVAGALHGAYIIAIGGDYMHARLLLPAFFALAVPASLAVERRSLPAIATASIAVVWSIVAIGALRPPPPPRSFTVADVADWRTVAGATVVPKDVTLALNGVQVGEAYRAGERGYLTLVSSTPMPGKDPHLLVVDMGSIGVPAWHAGIKVWVVDIGGLAEPLAARFPDVPGRPAGHRKATQTAWYDARFGAAVGGPKVVAARHVLTCQPISGLLRAVDAPLTPSRFISNVFHSFSYTRLHIPDDPVKAEQEFCKSPG